MAKEIPGPSIGHWLDENQISFRQLLEALPVGAYTCDSQGRITYFNQRAVELWGREPKLNDPAERFCGSFKLFSTNGLPILHDHCWMALAIKNEKDYPSQEVVIERQDGSRVTGVSACESAA